MILCRMLYIASLCSTLLAPPSAMPAHTLEAGAHASIASTSRWWKLKCGKTGRKREAETTACAFTVKLRGVIDGSRLQLVRHALQRRSTVRHALHREVDFHIDVDSQGGELFATLEIGRIMRAERASISVGPEAACISACVFLLASITVSATPDNSLSPRMPFSSGAGVLLPCTEAARVAECDAG